jgi:hypothetical protein
MTAEPSPRNHETVVVVALRAAREFLTTGSRAGLRPAPTSLEIFRADTETQSKKDSRF